MPKEPKTPESFDDWIGKRLEGYVNKYNAAIDKGVAEHPELKGKPLPYMNLAVMRDRVKTYEDVVLIWDRIRDINRKGAFKMVEVQKGEQVPRFVQWDIKKFDRVENKRTADTRRELAENLLDYAKKGINPMEDAARQNRAKERNYNVQEHSARDVYKYFEAAENRARANYDAEQWKEYKEHYLLGIGRQLGDDNDPHGLYQKIQRLKPEFVGKHYKDEQEMKIEWVYDKQQKRVIQRLAIQAWDRAIEAAKASGEDWEDEEYVPFRLADIYDDANEWNAYSADDPDYLEDLSDD